MAHYLQIRRLASASFTKHLLAYFTAATNACVQLSTVITAVIFTTVNSAHLTAGCGNGIHNIY